ncbi:unnamed protein product, partial [Phaeothamnion confervicola]
ALDEAQREQIRARRRARKWAGQLYWMLKGFGVAVCTYTAVLNGYVMYANQVYVVQEQLMRSYLLLFCITGVLAELDTPFARDNFRALQKWWFKAPFYVFMGWVCWDPLAKGVLWQMELASLVAFHLLAGLNIMLNVCLRELLLRSGVLRRKKRWATDGTAADSDRTRGGGGG